VTRTLYLFINGIFVDPEQIDDWQDRAVRWVGAADIPGAWADRYEYHTDAAGRRLKQEERVDRVYRLIQAYRSAYGPDLRIVVGAHSNGAAIIVDALRTHPGLRVNELHLFAAAADPDFRANRLNDVLLSGYCGRVTCHCSPDDGALKAAHWSKVLFGWAGLGYGDLGRVGPTNVDPDLLKAGRVVTRWNPGFGHSTYFAPDHFETTMRLVAGGKAA
jgi:hypothetical protein